MIFDDWLQVPIGVHVERWRTRRQERTVLMVAHSVTSLQRLLDVTPLFDGDKRIQVVFTHALGAFFGGVQEMFADLGVAVVPWRQAVNTPFDLAVASGYSGLDHFNAPVVVLPHGAGYNKFIPPVHPRLFSAGLPVFGLSAQQLIRDGQVIPSVIVLSHDRELLALKEHCPEALPAALVAGDPCFDRIRRSLGQRAEYRDILGVEVDQDLVVISSTWGEDSLYGSSSDVLGRVAREASDSGVAVVVLLHPNVWYGHSRWQIRAWFRKYRRSGLFLIEPELDWRSYLICADKFIGDHGSVSLYAMAAGVPSLRVDFPDNLIVPGSAMDLLRLTVPVVDDQSPVLTQLDEVSAGDSRREGVLDRVTSRPASSARALRASFYQQMNLDEPDEYAEFDLLPPPVPLRSLS